MIKIEITNASDIEKELSKLAHKVETPAPALQEIGQRWLSFVQLGFRDSGMVKAGMPSAVSAV